MAERHILDSGNRRQFESGAVRDIAEGKGRMDLLPLDIVAKLSEIFYEQKKEQYLDLRLNILVQGISSFMRTGDTKRIYYMLVYFIHNTYSNFETAMLELSIQYEEGAKKYQERNWEKGIYCHCYIDSALRHYFKFSRGDVDEPHDRAFMWNLMGLLWTLENKPELNDLPYNKTSLSDSTKCGEKSSCREIIHGQ